MNHSKAISRMAVAALVSLATVGYARAQDEPVVVNPERAAAEAAAAPTWTVIMKDLNNPRGIALGPDGSVFVVEAGKGNVGTDEKSPSCTKGTLSCYGHTGAVSRYWKGVQEQVATGLPSIAFPAGNQARGPHDIAFNGMGNARVTLGLEFSPATRDANQWVGSGHLADIPAKVLMAPSNHLRPTEWNLDADLAAFEAVADPDPRIVESDPYSIVAEPDGYVVTDASGNSLVRVDKKGEMSVLGVFPTRPQRLWDSVPTTVTIGPDGAYYVGEFVGFGTKPPAPNGEAKIYRVVPGEAPTVFCSGFSRIIDIAFDTDGSLWVLQHYTNMFPLSGGILYRVVPPPLESPDRSCPDRAVVPTGVTLDQPTSIALAPDAIYISNHGALKDIGQVIRVER